MSTHLALVGDFSPQVIAHQAIPRALDHSRVALGRPLTWEWVPTREVRDASRDLARFDAIWLVPASPYENMTGALDAIRFARESLRPFLGTCGGFQHALIEFARHAGLPTADHAETNPHGTTLVVSPLTCSLREKTGEIRFVPGSRLHTIYGRDIVQEGYHCSYGVNPLFRATLERAGLQFTAVDHPTASSDSRAPEGDIRGAELPSHVHPFFVGTLFQPERAALRGELPPIVRAFVAAALQNTLN